jgi:DNA modification methylase
MAKQIPIGDELFGTPMEPATAPQPSSVEPPADLEEIQADSEKQALPEQEKVFRVAGRVRSKLNNLPDPTKPPLGFVPGRGFDVVFPFVKLPHLAPNLNGDWVQFGSPDLEPNRLYYGDNLQVLRTLPSNSIDLIYIDPPFFSGAEYNMIWGDTNEVRTFSDIWEGGLDTYLIWLNARLWEMRRVLKDTSSIYVHCDWHASHYIKAEMDKIFGYGMFRNDISWVRSLPHNDPKQFGRSRDTLLLYGKSESTLFNPQHRPQKEESVEAHYRQGEDGKMYRLASLLAPGGRGPRYAYKGIVRNWRFTPEKMAELEQQGRVYHEPGKMPSRILYFDESLGALLQDHWNDISPLNPQAKERIGYPTQKPESLLERIILASSNPGDSVADFFCGGGVAAAVAQRLGRRWIACDSSRVAISVTLNRLVHVGEEQSGVISNYGKAGQVQTKMELPTPEDAIPDIRVHYVGVYPMDRFKAIDQPQFDKFVLACLAAQADNSDNAITGWRSAREPLRVGPADPDESPDAGDVKDFFEAVLRKLEPNIRTIARYVCWRISPELKGYRRKLSDYIRRNVQPRGADLDFDFLLIDSEEFRERIRQKYPDADDNEFLLKFTKEPVIAEIAATRLGPRRYSFEARDADSTNIGGYLVNCQWDFDYNRGHFAADPAYVLGRTELKGKEAKAAGHKFEAVLTAEHTFESADTRTVACRVQDNLGAEAIRTLTIEVA